MRYYVFTDLENTLSKNIEELNQEQLDMIKQMGKNIKFCISTASSYSEIKHFLTVNNLNWNYICEGGSLAYFGGLTYNKQFKLAANNLLQFVNNIVFMFYQLDEVTYVYNYLEYLKSIYPKYSNIVKLDDISQIRHTKFNQMYICINQTVRNQFVEILEQNKIDASLLMEDSKNVLFRLRAKHINKGYFIPYILSDNNIPYDSTIGFGDSIQDIAIIKQTNKKVAVSNAEPLLKCETTEICESVTDNGVFKYLINLLYENS